MLMLKFFLFTTTPLGAAHKIMDFFSKVNLMKRRISAVKTLC
jgi:hypothetical protein